MAHRNEQSPLIVQVGSKFFSTVYQGSVKINRLMLETGYAWAYRNFLSGPHASEFPIGEKEARAKKLGLWKQTNPQAPWEIR